MNHRTLLSILAGFALATLTASSTAQSTSTVAAKPAKLVIQVSDAEPAKWNLAINNARNVQDELGAKNVEIEIVAYGPGLGMLKKDAPTSGRLDEASLAGIKLVACENTMRNQKLTKADIHASASYANSGVVHIMQRQASGWSYVRP
jgi:intracellular sulfur oxidation DsrE/DsrF family protein